MAKKIVLLSLQTFSTTGGIQKMTRTLAHALYGIAKKNSWDFRLWSAYDSAGDLLSQYLPADHFKCFGGNRTRFVFSAILKARAPDVLILSHINLAVIGLIIKLINPGCKVWLFAHGIEVWRPLSFLKGHFLKRCDQVVCVSHFTKAQMIARHQVAAERCEVLNNVVDPFMELPVVFQKPEVLLKRHRVGPNDRVIFTLARLASTEQYKGHDQVIMIMAGLVKKYPGLKYILGGQYDHREEIRIQKLISSNHVDEHVILTGYIEESELADYFLLADVFVLPSKKEGFGIVFIEALACGTPVICGNADGSIDAICNGELGTAIPTDDKEQLLKALIHHLDSPPTPEKRFDLQQRCLERFNERNYMDEIEKMIADGGH